MKATLIYGYAGSGKSRFVYDLCKNSGAKSVFIVPDQYTHQTELDIISALGTCGITDTEVFSFKRLSHRLKLLYGGASVIMMSNEGRTMLVNAIINKIRNDGDNALLKNASVTDITSDMVNLISRLKQYGISPEELENCNIDAERYSHTKSKLNEVAKVYREYLYVSQNIAGMAFTDAEDDMELLCKNIAQSRVFVDTDVYIDGFDDFIRPELKVLQTLIMHAKSVTVTLPCEINAKPNRGLLFYRQKKMISEVERILDLCNVVPKKINISDRLTESDGIIAVPATRRSSDELNFIQENIFSSACYGKPVRNVKIYTEQSVKDETEHTADKILSLVRDKGYRFNDIALVCGDVECYSRYIAKSFSDRNIPYFMDVKRNIRSNAIISFVCGLLDIVCKNRNTDSVLSFIKSGLLVKGYNTEECLPFDFNDVAYLEKYCTAYYIKSKDWSKPFEYGNNFYDINRLNTIRENVMSFIVPFEDAVQKAKTACEISAVIENYLSQMNISDIVNAKITYLIENGRNDTASEYGSVWNTLSEMLNQISVFMNDAQMTYDEFADMLKKSFENTTVNVIPVCLDQVTILEKSRTMSKHVKALFIVGAENITVADESGIFNMSELELLKHNSIDIGADKNNGIGDVQYYIYKTLSKPTDLLFVSSVNKTDKDDDGLKSSLLTDSVKNLFGKNLCEIKSKGLPYLLSEIDNTASAESAVLFSRTMLENKYVKNDVIENLDNWLKKNGSSRYEVLSRTVKKGIDSKINGTETGIDGNILLKSSNGVYSVDISRLEKYANCPYAYFARYGLNIKPEGKGKVSSLDIGNIVHDMLDGFVGEILSKQNSNEKNVTDYVEDNFERLVSEYQTGRISVNEENRYILKRVKNILIYIMTVMLKRKSRASTEIYATELKFDNNGIKYGGIPSLMCEAPDGTSFNITGKIDSIEYAVVDGKKYWIINDYKTGAKPTPAMINGTKSLQLPIYMSAMLEYGNATEPGAMFYINVNDDIVTENVVGNADISDILEKRCGKTGIVADIKDLMGAIDSEGVNTKNNEYDLEFSNIIYDKKLLAKKDIKDLYNIIENAKKKASEIFCDIKNGKIDKKPLNKLNCERCEFRRLCGYEVKYGGNDTENGGD